MSACEIYLCLVQSVKTELQRIHDDERIEEVTFSFTDTNLLEVDLNILTKALNGFEFPKHVESLHIFYSKSTFDTKELMDALLAKIYHGPKYIAIHSWPEHSTIPLLQVLMSKEDLEEAFLSICDQCQPDHLAILASTIKKLSLVWKRRVDDIREWKHLGNAIAASTTLTHLFMGDYVPENAFPPHMPINLHSFEFENDDVGGEDALPLDWISHEYYPKQLSKIHVHDSSDAGVFRLLPDPAAARFRNCEILNFYTICKPEPLCRVLFSGANRIRYLGIAWDKSIHTLQGYLTSPHAIGLRQVRINMMEHVPRIDLEMFIAAVRKHTLIRNLSVFVTMAGRHVSLDLGGDWFAVMQTLLSVREVPRIAMNSGSLRSVAMIDFIPTIAKTLRWPTKLADVDYQMQNLWSYYGSE